ncbi:MAG: hypothetical protein FWH21_01835 [Kiritimatiellaeota bacterium]|nr:hypothetical protein [Kiritimatiellota bacterium]
MKKTLYVIIGGILFLGIFYLLAYTVLYDWIFASYQLEFEYEDGTRISGTDTFDERKLKALLAAGASGRVTYLVKGEKIREFYIKDGKWHGEYKHWEGGVLLYSNNFFEGRHHGEQRSWWREGIPKEYYVCSHAHRIGTSTNWYENEVIASIKTYGMEGGYKETWDYSLSGRLVAHCVYSNGYPRVGTLFMRVEDGIPIIGSFTNGIFNGEWQDTSEQW